MNVNQNFKQLRDKSKMVKFLQIDRTMKQAFEMWEAATDLTFSLKSSGSVHIEIRFERYEHGDGDAFDGPGGTLAHAYFPQVHQRVLAIHNEV